MERFVLVSPRAVSPAGTQPRIHPPIGSISVLAEVKREGFDAVLFDAAAEGLKKGILDPTYQAVTVEELDGIQYWKTGLRIDEIVAEVIKFQPDAIGIGCCTIVDRSEVAKTAKALRDAFPTTPIILGGHEASQWYREILGETTYPIEMIPEIDYVVVGPGQPVVAKLLRHLENSLLNEMPAGVAKRNGDHIEYSGSPDFQPNSHALLDYNLLPRIQVPGREKPMDLYSFVGNPHAGRIGTLLGKDWPVAYLPLLTSYGCGFGCSFCDTDKRLVRYSVDNTLKIIDAFDQLFGIDYIDFMDNNFGGGNTVSRTIAFETLSHVHESGHQIGFSNGLTFESMTREDFRLLRTFGENGNVRHVAFPCENGNDRVLRMIQKPHTLPIVRKALAFAKKHMSTTNREGFFIGGFPETNGQPAERPDELEKTFQFITECLEEQWLHQAIFLTLSPITREYRMLWRKQFPTASFEHCLFSRKTGVWPYPNALLDEMRANVQATNQRLGRSVTRKL